MSTAATDVHALPATSRDQALVRVGAPRRRAVAKRLLDIALVLVLSVAAVPVVLVLAVAIKLDSPGKVLFRQERVGQGGRRFGILKLRTMVPEAELLLPLVADQNEAEWPLFRIHRDPRCTPVGRVLRALGLDELPQLWNVLRGDMSMVGPRPALAHEMERWTPAMHRRLDVKPGITGTWQISGAGRWARFEEYARLDLQYVDHWSVWTDLVILAKTLPSLIPRRGR
jgi:lipopolysaccharide/colanic/teichoic acid biosynthesis glycosyltransferase